MWLLYTLLYFTEFIFNNIVKGKQFKGLELWGSWSAYLAIECRALTSALPRACSCFVEIGLSARERSFLGAILLLCSTFVDIYWRADCQRCTSPCNTVRQRAAGAPRGRRLHLDCLAGFFPCIYLNFGVKIWSRMRYSTAQGRRPHRSLATSCAQVPHPMPRNRPNITSWVSIYSKNTSRIVQSQRGRPWAQTAPPTLYRRKNADRAAPLQLVLNCDKTNTKVIVGTYYSTKVIWDVLETPWPFI